MFNSPFELNTFRKKFDKIIARNKAMHSKLESSLFYNPPPPFTGSYKKIQRSKRPIFLMEKNNWMRRTQNGDKIVTNFNKIQDVSKFSKKIRSIHTPKNNNLHCYFKTQAKEQVKLHKKVHLDVMLEGNPFLVPFIIYIKKKWYLYI